MLAVCSSFDIFDDYLIQGMCDDSWKLVGTAAHSIVCPLAPQKSLIFDKWLNIAADPTEMGLSVIQIQTYYCFSSPCT